MRTRAGIVAALVAAFLASTPAAGVAAAPAKVEIEPTGFDPAVVVVGPGTEVRWTNRDARSLYRPPSPASSTRESAGSRS